jgi:hypothetical protein
MRPPGGRKTGLETRSIRAPDRHAAEALCDDLELAAAEQGLRPRERRLRRSWPRGWSATMTLWHLDATIDAAIRTPSPTAVREALRRLVILRSAAKVLFDDDPSVLRRKTLDTIAIEACLRLLAPEDAR